MNDKRQQQQKSESPHRWRDGLAVCSLGGKGWVLGRGAHSVWLRDLANIGVSRGRSRWCPAYVESEPALLNTTNVTRQQCSVSFGWQPTNDLTSLPVDPWGRGGAAEWVLGVAGSKDAGTSGAGAVSLRSAQMMGLQQQQQILVKPVLNWANVCSPNILRTVRRTMIRF